jgi:hypothetical protein
MRQMNTAGPGIPARLYSGGGVTDWWPRRRVAGKSYEQAVKAAAGVATFVTVAPAPRES